MNTSGSPCMQAGGGGGGLRVPGGAVCHTPMSERQQLALIKQLEKSGGSSSTSSDCSPCINSPPRTPLGVLNSDLSTPNSRQTGSTASRSLGNTPRTPAEERIYKKVTKKNHRGETALQCAAIKGNIRLVRKLLRLGADPNCKDNAGWTPLHEACNRGNSSVAQLLIKAGSYINVPGMFKETPLHDAARNGHYKVVKLLVASGADVTALNDNKKTPLEVASNPENPCQNPDLQRVIRYLGGGDNEPDQQEPDSSPIQEPEEGGEEELDLEEREIFQEQRRGQGLRIRGQLFSVPASRMANNSGAATGANGEEVTSTNQKEDVYEFKTSSKEATPTSSRGSASPGNAGENVGEKRPAATGAEGDEDDTAANKKRKKTDESSGSGGSNAGSGSNGRGRGVRGNSSDKGNGKQGGRGRGSAAGSSSGSSNTERRSPPVRGDNSPAPSPGKGKQPKNEQLNGGAGGESDDDGEKKEGGLKVPPLKIVLNNGSNNRDEDKKKGSYIVNNADEQEGGEGGATKPGGDSEQTSSGEEKTSGSRVTRSRGGGNGEEDGPSESQAEEDRKQTNEYVLKKRKVRSQQEEPAVMGNGITRPSGEPLTDLEKHLNIRKQIEQRRKNLFPVQPKPPHGFRDYLMNKKTYHLQGNTGKDSRIQPIPKIAPPPSLDGPFRELFLTQENERYKLRMKHLVEKEKLVLAVEQEILRVHGRAARALANQSLPYSVCTILRDREIYTTIDPNQEENRDIRSRYNGRVFFSWLQDVDDKWEKIKEQMVLRHHNEAESLNAVQKMDWEWKLGEFPGNKLMTRPCAGDLHVPMVQVSDDFDQLLS